MNILAVDDVQLIRTLVKQAVALLEGTVMEASNGVEAMRMLRSNSSNIDLVLLDWNMPKMNGIEVLRAIKNDDKLKHIPVIMTTTKSERQSIIEAIQTGANHYLVKPFTSQELIKKILSCTGTREPFSRCLSIALKKTLKKMTGMEVTENLIMPEDESPKLFEGEDSLLGQINFFGNSNGTAFISLDKESALHLLEKAGQTSAGLTNDELVESFSKVITQVTDKAADMACLNVIKPVFLTGFMRDSKLIVKDQQFLLTQQAFSIAEIKFVIKLHVVILQDK